MEYTDQQAGNSANVPVAQEASPTLPQTVVSTPVSQFNLNPTPMVNPGQAQFPPPLPLQNTLVPLTLKLDRNNFAIWRSLILPAVRALDIEGFLDGSRVCPPRFVPNSNGEGSSTSTQPHITVNPDYVAWIRMDQAVMVWLLGSISEGMLGHVVRCASSQQIWSTLTSLFSSNSKARLLQLCFQLQMLKKGSMTIHDYFLKMKGIADTLASTG